MYKPEIAHSKKIPTHNPQRKKKEKKNRNTHDSKCQKWQCWKNNLDWEFSEQKHKEKKENYIGISIWEETSSENKSLA